MARFLIGDVVFVPVPYADQEEAKRRLALVLAHWDYGSAVEYLLCAITTTPPRENSGMELTADDFDRGALPRQSFLRPYYLFAKAETSIAYTYGKLTAGKVAAVKHAIMALLDS